MKQLPAGITEAHIHGALLRIESDGAPAEFGHSSTYDVWFEGVRYPPKAVMALAAEAVTGEKWGPDDFSGGEGAGRPNPILRKCGFVVVDKKGLEVLGPGGQRGTSVAPPASNRRASEAMSHFTWIPFYEELARKLLDFEHRQDELLDFLTETRNVGLPVIRLDDEFEKGGGALEEIDLFSFFATFNRGLSDSNRQAILKRAKKQFQIQAEVPKDFDGIPVVDNLQSWFFPYTVERTPGTISALWTIARQAVTDGRAGIDGALFDRCLEIKSVGIAKLTMGLFWTRPTEFLPFDSRTRAFLAGAGLGNKARNWRDYASLLETVETTFGGQSFVALSWDAFWESENGGTVSRQMTNRRYWVEKTHVKGRADRESGPHGLGKALWSPTTSKSGGDIHRNMREVRAGDVILHLIDNRHITGVSVASGAVSTEFGGERFRGLDGTPWKDCDCYRIEVEDYIPVDPPLDRDWILNERALGQFRGRKGVFFDKNLDLNQGSYLTEAKADMVAVLDAAYRQHTDQSLPHIDHVESDEVEVHVPLSSVHRQFADALTAANLRFGGGHDAFVRAFLASLVTKRFVLLTGLSGSGKTQIARMFGHWIGKDRYRCIPVRPDWTGPEALLGYESALEEPIEGRQPWRVPDALEFMLEAAADPERPYLLLLDEMNLAHVERYFADILSGMESGDGCIPNLVRRGQKWVVGDGGARLPLPKNLFVVGTVNVDETTYMFSPKVLDRANTIEFRVTADDLPEDPNEIRSLTDCAPGSPSAVRQLLRVARNPDGNTTGHPDWIDHFAARLREVHRLLSPYGFEFGHRVYMEAVRFAAIHVELGDPDLEAALDLQLMQKMLPRIHGARRRIEKVLRGLGSVAYHGEMQEDPTSFDPLNIDSEEEKPPALPKTFDKVQRMLQRLQEQQFASFAE